MSADNPDLLRTLSRQLSEERLNNRDLCAALELVLSVRMIDNLTSEQYASVKATLAKARVTA